MRGFLNVFSLGMDSLAAELRGAGISATVASYAGWQDVAREIAANYKAGQHGPIVLVGHSFGADAVMDMGQYLGEMGVPVALIIPFDETYPHAASANVARVLNIYKSADAKITRGPGFHGEITNYYVPDANVGHMNIDNVPRLHSMVINRIRGTRSSEPQYRLAKDIGVIVLRAAGRSPFVRAMIAALLKAPVWRCRRENRAAPPPPARPRRSRRRPA